jgi:polar amino acid transport system permease protein
LLTLRVGLLGILFATIIGVLIAAVRYFKAPVISQILAGYVEFARNTPLLIQLFFIYFGLPKITGGLIDAEFAGIVGITFLGAAYMSENFRSGFLNVPAGLVEAGEVLGLTKLQLVREVIFPLGFKISLPGVFANFIFLLKETSVVSIIGLTDLVAVADTIRTLQSDTDTAMLMLVVSYLVLLVPFVLFFEWLNGRVNASK